MKRKEIPIKQIKHGVKIKAVLMRENKTSWLLDCEGDMEWFLKSECNFNQESGEIEAPKQVMERKFPDYKF